MKRTFFFVLVILSSTYSLQASPYFYLKIEVPSVWTAECTMYNEQNQLMAYKIELRRMTNDAQFTLEIEQPKFITVSYAGESFDIFVEPTDDLKIFFQNNKSQKAIHFEGRGADNNKTLVAFQNRFRNPQIGHFKTQFLSPTVDAYTENRILSTDSGTFLSLTNKDKEAELDFLNQSKAHIHKQLYSSLWKESNYIHDSQLYAYFLLKNIDADEMRLTAQRFFSFKGFNYTDYERNQTEAFRNALKTFVHFQAKQFQIEASPHALFQVIEKKLTGYDRFWLEKELFIEVLDKTHNPSFGRQHIEEFRKNCTFVELTKEVEEAYMLYLDVTERTEAPDLQLVTVDGNPINLKSFKGKVVYLSFWASWCQPCIANFTKYAEVRNRLHTEGVVLLNVNIDEQIDKFRSSVTNLNITGWNVQPMNINEAKRLYSLFSIPSYFIIDKQGKFAHLSDNQGRDIISEFKKILAE